MPAGPIGSVWVAGSWSDTSWAANSWSNAVVRSGHGEPFWSIYRRGQIRPRREALVRAIGVAVRAALGIVRVQVVARIKPAVAFQAVASVGTVTVLADQQRRAVVRVRHASGFQAQGAVGRVRVHTAENASESQMRQALEWIDKLTAE